MRKAIRKAASKIAAAADKASDKVRKVSANVNKKRVARNVAKGNVEKAARIAGKPGKRAAKVTARGAKKANKLTNKAAAVTAKSTAKAEKINPTPKPKATKIKTKRGTGKTYEMAWEQSSDAYKKRFGGDKAKAIAAMKEYNRKYVDKPSSYSTSQAVSAFKKLRFGRRKK
tara:strand:+ start:215 stop:727 length:513 start_codon:yes stop_codon:yes gene_type:complete